MSKSVLTLGTFDGVHRGHQALIRKVVSRARALGVKSVVLAFDRPPRHAGEPPVKPVLLTLWPEKRGLLKRWGIDRVERLVFNHRLASITPSDFFDKVILKAQAALEMVVGPRVAFGKNRAGRLPLLRRMGRAHGVRIHVVPNVATGNGSVSSRQVRSFLTRGNIERVNALLGYPYSVSGKVVHGDRRGRRLGFPTANIQVEAGKMMPRGVYWVKVHPANFFPLTPFEVRKGIDGLCNIGVRPTFTPRSEVAHCEVFLLNGPSHRPGPFYYCRWAFLVRVN